MVARKLVLVEWIDSHSGDNWQPLDKIAESDRPIFCRSVGWLVSQKNGATVLVPHIAGERNGNLRLYGTGDISIPTKAIVRTKTLLTEGRRRNAAN